MYNWIKPAIIAALLTNALTSRAEEPHRYGFGHPVNAAEIRPWDIDIAPDGRGLPPGGASAEEGEEIYLQRCAACHGDFGEGMGRFPVLIGSPADLSAERPRKTVGGYWPYATTLWDYINRAMPFGYAQSLTAQQVYAITAYILAVNDIIDSDQIMNAQTLPAVKMPNRNGFIRGDQSDIHATACMANCKDEVTIKSRASENPINITDE